MGTCLSKKTPHLPYDYKTTKEDIINKHITDSMYRVIYNTIISINWTDETNLLYNSIQSVKNILTTYNKTLGDYILGQPISNIIVITFLNQSFKKKNIFTAQLQLIINQLLRPYINNKVCLDGMIYYSIQEPFCAFHPFENSLAIRTSPMFVTDILLQLGRITQYQLATILSLKINDIMKNIKIIPSVDMLPTQGVHLKNYNNHPQLVSESSNNKTYYL
jgi:hypothetical protein